MILLADIVTNLSLIATAVALGLAAAGQITIWITMKSPQKREVTFAADLVDKKEFEKALNENKEVHNQLFAKLGGTQRGVEDRIQKYEAAADLSRARMHEEIGDIGREVSTIAANTETNTQRLAQMDGKIDRLGERLAR